MLYRLALGITLHTAEAEDVVQDTMLKAWRHRDEWNGIDNMGAWLTQICRRLALDRKQKLDRMTQLSDGNDKEAASMAQGSADTSFERNEQYGTIYKLMDSLPPPQGDIIRLREVEGLSYTEIAQQLELTEDQVRVYLFRARQRVKKEYSKIANYGL